MDKPWWMWVTFFAVVISLLALDLGVLHRKAHAISVKESLRLSALYTAIGLLFGGWVWYDLGAASGRDYLTGFIVELSLSMDNIFVMSLIFSYFAIPRHLRHRVLFWGILGAIFMRGAMIGLGAALIERFEWVLYLFAAFLVFSGIKMLIVAEEEEKDIGENRILKYLKKHLRTTHELHGNQFTVMLPHPRHPDRQIRYFTPLFVALIMIEIADLIFAVDSVPAIFAITTDPFIVYTSNIFAILGLRAMFFALDAIVHRFEYLKYALALVLVFIGGKVFATDLLGIEKLPASISLGVTIALLAGGVIFSLFKTKQEKS